MHVKGIIRGLCRDLHVGFFVFLHHKVQLRENCSTLETFFFEMVYCFYSMKNVGKEMGRIFF